MAPPTDSERDGHRREVDAEREDAARGQGAQVAAGSAADVEHGPAHAAQQLLVGGVGRAEVALERQREHSPVAQSGAAAPAHRHGVAQAVFVEGEGG